MYRIVLPVSKELFARRRARRAAAPLAVLLSAMAALAYADAPTPLSAHDVARLRSVAAAEISPDGQRIAYVLRVQREPGRDKNGPAWTELHVTDLDGLARPFISGQVSVSGVQWTPDGRRISFLSKRGDDKRTSLYAIPFDGGEAQRLVAHDENISDYAWSPDGKLVAFLAREKEDSDRKKRREKGFNARIFEEDWRPVRVFVTDVGAGDAKPRMLNLPGSANGIRWSPNGDVLAVGLAPTPLVDDQMMKRQIHIVNVERGEVVGHVPTPGKLGQFEFSTGGKHLALLAGEDIHDPGEGRLMLVPATGGETRDLLPGFMGQVERIAWQDDDTILYIASEGVWTTLAKVGTDGDGRRTIVETGGPILSRLSLAADGQSGALVADSPQHPSEVYYMKHGDAAPRRLTDSNPWLAERRLAVQEPIEYTARDGLMIEGILIRPLDERPGQRYPLIVIVHGGPEAHVSNGWVTGYNVPGQIAAGRGFAAFYPNYRGSTGRGVEFSKLGQGDAAGAEFDDLVDAIPHLEAMELIDRSKVGVTGGSYGGYASAWGATKLTEHFAAAVMFVGISDRVAKSGTTDIPNEEYLVHARKWPWEDWEQMRDRSPLTWTPQARTPILICHGEEDTRVHPAQSLSMYRYLKLLGQVPVRLVLYPGEGHGNRNAAARLDYSLRLLRWMEHYLVGPGGDPPPYELDYGLELDEAPASDDEDDNDE